MRPTVDPCTHRAVRHCVATPWRWLIALALLLSSTVAQAQSWKKLTAATDGFEVEFPADVSILPVKFDPQRVDRSTNYGFSNDPAFALLVSASRTKDEPNFTAGARDSFATFKCSTTTSDQTLPLPRGQGRALQGSGCAEGFSVLARYFSVDRWFYQVLAVYRPDHADVARRFVESFKLIPR